jgi:hypothetical protein
LRWQVMVSAPEWLLLADFVEEQRRLPYAICKNRAFAGISQPVVSKQAEK